MKSKLLLFLILPAMLIGCDAIFPEGDVKKSYDGPTVVGFFPLNAEVRRAQTETFELEVQLIGKQRSTDLPVAFSVTSPTGVAGDDYTVSSSPVTIASGTSSAFITITFGSGMTSGDEVVLNFTLEGGDGVEPSVNLANSRIELVDNTTP